MKVTYESNIKRVCHGSYNPSKCSVIVEHGAQFVHHGVKGQKWGVRRYQNYDGTWKDAKYKRGWEANEKFKSMAKSGKKADIDKANEYYKQNKKDIKMGRKMERKSIRQNKSANIGEKQIKEGKTVGKAVRRTVLLGAAASGSKFIAKALANRAVNHAYAGMEESAIKNLRNAGIARVLSIGLRVATLGSALNSITRGVSQSRAKDRAHYETTHQKKLDSQKEWNIARLNEDYKMAKSTGPGKPNPGKLYVNKKTGQSQATDGSKKLDTEYKNKGYEEWDPSKQKNPHKTWGELISDLNKRRKK